ncbi:MAG: hypothetical protein AAGD25_05005 [Cyanobacteria bacterium P01_F01_bin.150]
MATLICLANSWKHGERCIAGIDIYTGQWVRPVCDRLPDGQVPADIRLIDGDEPALLDILSIPLAYKVDRDRMARENYWIRDGQWQRIDRAQPARVMTFCSCRPQILHTERKYVSEPWLRSQPLQNRRTLELIRTQSFQVTGDVRSTGTRWKGSFTTALGQTIYQVPITDPAFVAQLDQGHRPSAQCLITMSLGLPHRPPSWEGDDPCWKLIAGVIELSVSDLILIEMQRVGWTIAQGRDWLDQKYHKRSRQQLSAREQTEFLKYLKALQPGPLTA